MRRRVHLKTHRHQAGGDRRNLQTGPAVNELARPRIRCNAAPKLTALFVLSPVCTPGVLNETTAMSMPASFMNEMLASLDQRSGASPPTGAFAFSVASQKKSGNMW